ncbi:MAG: AI-2E family transporter [Bacilli bacterium]|jgi:predicted PurR-regulated permease PerM
MFFKSNNDKKLNIKALNQVISSTNYILKIMQILLLIIGVYAITLILEKWGLITFIFTILKILIPFFIGLVIAWLLNPAVIYLEKKDINRTFGTIIVYFALILSIYVLLNCIIPFFSTQINDFVSTMPNMTDTLENWINNFFSRFDNNTNTVALKVQIFDIIETVEARITTEMPTLAVAFFTNFLSGVGTFILALLIGFFMLFDFDNVIATILKIVPKNIEHEFKIVMKEIDASLRQFVQSTLLLSVIVFVISTIGFYFIGLKAPVIFGLICGITNIIPIIGPYIGGFIASIAGLVQGATVGILTIILVIVTQFVESEFIGPLIMSKVMKLHPVTIIVALLIFGHLFGIAGMIISTPIIAILKILIVFFNKKYDIFNFN